MFGYQELLSDIKKYLSLHNILRYLHLSSNTLFGRGIWYIWRKVFVQKRCVGVVFDRSFHPHCSHEDAITSIERFSIPACRYRSWKAPCACSVQHSAFRQRRGFWKAPCACSMHLVRGPEKRPALVQCCISPLGKEVGRWGLGEKGWPALGKDTSLFRPPCAFTKGNINHYSETKSNFLVTIICYNH